MRALFNQANVVDHQAGRGAAHQQVGFFDQLGLQRQGVPGRVGNEIVELLAIHGRHALGDRGHAFALTRQDQPLHVERCPLALGGMGQAL